MSEAAQAPMTADAFLAWSLTQPERPRYELDDGVVVQMASERTAHARTKFRVARLLADAVETAGLACEVYPDGMAVRVDHRTVYEPDALLRCGERLVDDVVIITDPMVVVEVVSPCSASMDSGAKLAGYFRIPSVRHYLIVRTWDRVVIQHSRAEDGSILTRIVLDGEILLEPPGVVLDGLFESQA